MTPQEFAKVNEDLARKERGRQSRRALLIVGVLAMFGLLIAGLAAWLNATST